MSFVGDAVQAGAVSQVGADVDTATEAAGGEEFAAADDAGASLLAATSATAVSGEACMLLWMVSCLVVAAASSDASEIASFGISVSDPTFVEPLLFNPTTVWRVLQVLLPPRDGAVTQCTGILLSELDTSSLASTTLLVLLSAGEYSTVTGPLAVDCVASVAVTLAVGAVGSAAAVALLPADGLIVMMISGDMTGEITGWMTGEMTMLPVGLDCVTCYMTQSQDSRTSQQSVSTLWPCTAEDGSPQAV